MRIAIRRLVVFLSAGVLAAGVAVSGTTRADAYGTEHLYQITFSLNCMNLSLCVANAQNPFGIGGAWGWMEPDSDGTAEVAAEFQGHSNAQAFLNGSGHLIGPAPWTIVPIASPPFGTLPDPNGLYFVIPVSSPFGPVPFVFPSTPGQYHGQLAPGINAETTVTAMH